MNIDEGRLDLTITMAEGVMEDYRRGNDIDTGLASNLTSDLLYYARKLRELQFGPTCPRCGAIARDPKAKRCSVCLLPIARSA